MDLEMEMDIYTDKGATQQNHLLQKSPSFSGRKQDSRQWFVLFVCLTDLWGLYIGEQQWKQGSVREECLREANMTKPLLLLQVPKPGLAAPAYAVKPLERIWETALFPIHILHS